MLSANGTCVSRIVKTSAGSSGNRRRHESERRIRLDGAGGAWLPELSSPPSPGGDALTVVDRCVDVRAPGDHRRELLSALVADVLELRDADVLDTGKTGARRRARVVDRRGGDRVERRLGERSSRLLVLRDLIGRLPGARRDRCPAAGDLRAGLLQVLRTGSPGDVFPGEVGILRRLRDGKRPRPEP